MTELAGNSRARCGSAGASITCRDAEGVGNLYSCLPDGSDVRRHTRSRRLLRAPRADRRQAHRLSMRRRRLAVRSRDRVAPRASTSAFPRIARRRHASSFRPPITSADSTCIPAGHSLAVDARGKLFTFPLWEGAVRQLGAADGVRYRLPQWLDDGATLVAIGDGSGEERVEVFENGVGRTLPWDVGRVVAMRAAPRGRRDRHRQSSQRSADRRRRERRARSSSIAATRAAPRISRGRRTAHGSRTRSGRARGTARSSCTTSSTRSSVLATHPEFRDYCPAFDPDGRYLYFLSLRTFDPVYDSVQFELSFPRAARPYLIALQAGGRAAVRSGARRD